MLYLNINTLVLVVFFFSFLTSCNKKEFEGIHIDNIPLQQVYSNPNEYAAFCDLIEYNGVVYGCFRVAPNHVPEYNEDNGYIKIIKTYNGKKWEHEIDVKNSEYDLRDPCFCINNNGNLILYYGFYNAEDDSSIENRTGFTEFLLKNNKLCIVNQGNAFIIEKPNLWAWKIYQNQNKFYTVAYYDRGIFPQFAVSDDGINFSIISEIPVDGNETAISFIENRVYAFVRNFLSNGNCYVCYSDSPYKDWTIIEQNIALASPESFIIDNDIFVAGRTPYGMSLYKLNKNNCLLEPAYNYFAMGLYSDVGYPGIIIDDNDYVWTLFYGCDANLQFPSIYLTKLHFSVFLNGIYK